jgi:hypothetical protein
MLEPLRSRVLKDLHATVMESPLAASSFNNVAPTNGSVPPLARTLELLSTPNNQEINEGAVNGGKLMDERCEAVAGRIPPEMIAHIMFFALDLDQKPMGEVERQTFMDLRSVSSSWRRTAYTTPALWRCLVVDIWENPDFVALATGWFSRGGGTRLHLELISWGYLPDTKSGLDAALPLVAHSSFQFSTLVLGKNILRAWGCIQSMLSPIASKATVEGLVIWLPSLSALNPLSDLGMGTSLEKAFPRLKSLVLQGSISFAPVTHSSLDSLALNDFRIPASNLAGIFQNFPVLQELIIGGNGSVIWGRDDELQSIELLTLKRLTLVANNVRQAMESFLCPMLQWFHLSDIPNADWFDPLFGISLTAFIGKSQAPTFTLRVTNTRNSLGNLLPSVLAPSLRIHRLEVQGIDWLSRTRPTVLFTCVNDIPVTLREIVAWETPQKPRSISRNVGGARDEGQEEPLRTIDVYFPGGKEEFALLGKRCHEGDTQVLLDFHCISKGAIEHMMLMKNPIYCHAYDSLLVSD